MNRQHGSTETIPGLGGRGLEALTTSVQETPSALTTGKPEDPHEIVPEVSPSPRHSEAFTENTPSPHHFSKNIDPGIIDITKKGLILMGSSETRRVYGMLVSYLEGSTFSDYSLFQSNARYGEGNGNARHASSAGF